MPTCFIDNQPYKIKLADTPFVKNWLRVYDNKNFPVKKSIDKGAHNKIKTLALKHQNFFQKMGLVELARANSVDLWQRKNLSKIHLEIVIFQKNYKGSTDLMNKNTDGEWNNIHDYLHEQEKVIEKEKTIFGTGSVDLDHDSYTQSKNWSWEPILTVAEFHASASFDRWHFNVPLSELGRYPYECFKHSPDTWKQEGSLIGQISSKIKAQLSNTYNNPDKGYEDWCSQNKIPVIGDVFQLASFIDANDTKNIIEAKNIRITNDA